MILKKKPKPPRMGLREPEKIESAKHKRFIRSFACSVEGCAARNIEAAHHRTAANAGMQFKPSDEWCLPLCKEHHEEQHSKGHRTFQAKHKLDMAAKARAFARVSPDERIREKARRA